MSARSGAWLPIGLLVLLAGLTFWLNRAVQPPSPRADASARHDPDLIVEGFTARQLGPDGTVRYTLTARRMVHYPDDDTAHLETVRFDGIEQTGPRFHIEADRALMVGKGDQVTFIGNVVLVREATANSSRMTARTEYLHVIPDSGIATTDRPVVLQDATTTVHGASLYANNKARVSNLTQVKAIYVKPKRP